MVRPSSESVNVLEDSKVCSCLAVQNHQSAVIRKYVRQKLKHKRNCSCTVYVRNASQNKL